MLRLVIAGGGTGGHLYPGIAVAREAARERAEVLFIGTENGIEARVLPKEGLSFKPVRAGKFKGVGFMDKVKTLMAIPASIFEASRVIKGFGPQVVLGVGGYASFPAVVSAKLMRIPVVLQEQNAFPGLTNRVLGRFADKVCTGFNEAGRFFPARKTVFTGNPIRADLLKADRAGAIKEMGLDRGLSTVLVFGGSGGAHRINSAVSDALPLMAGLHGRVQFIHQTGDRDVSMVEEAYGRSGFTAKVLPFIYNMAAAYACADLVVCRSGALTLAEITALGKPALLIPYPHAADNHQEKNARALEVAGAAKVILDSDATGGRMAEEISRLINDKDALLGMSGRSFSLGRPDAARKVLAICKQSIKV
jgi:UDP-N-acetylglucosamine--N-acetylmuramyl-(pentapeptide) pyrophosphoryl-undecaprenol N-acetylglucosamine transferase